MGRRDTSADRAREAAERRARKFEKNLLRQEKKNADRLAQIEAENAAKQQAIQQAMAANQAELSKEPTSVRRKKRKPRGAEGLGRDRLRIALNQQGTSTNLG